MRVGIFTAFICLGLGPAISDAQSDRDFVFTDEEGHLLIRFAGAGGSHLDSSQAYEILNAEFSSMVHDRLHADLSFENEPLAPDWAASMEPQIEQHIKHAGPDFSDIFVECREASCRIIMEQPIHWSAPEEQRAVLEVVQASLESFIATSQQQFEPVFMITAYYQKFETSHIKAFLRRTGHEPPGQLAGG